MRALQHAVTKVYHQSQCVNEETGLQKDGGHSASRTLASAARLQSPTSSNILAVRRLQGLVSDAVFGRKAGIANCQAYEQARLQHRSVTLHLRRLRRALWEAGFGG